MKKHLVSISMLSGLLILSACGSQSSREVPLTSTSNNFANPSPTPIYTNGGNIYNLPAAPQQMIQLSGLNGNAFSKDLTFSTSHTLKVKVEALSAANLIIPGYTNWIFPYGCLRISVKVNGSTRQTKILRVASADQASTSECKTAPTYEILDFSDITTGSGPVTVTFSNSEYDNCRTYDPMKYGCSMKAVWQDHQVRFNATVQVDGTWMQ